VLVIAIIFLLLVVVFAVQNAQLVPITFMSWSLSINLALVVLGSASLGAIIGVVWAWFRNRPLRMKVKDLTRELNEIKEAKENAEQTPQDTLSDKEKYERKEDAVGRETP